MISLAISGAVLFSVSVAALAAPDTYRTKFFENTWKGLSVHDKQVSLVLNCSSHLHFGSLSLQYIQDHFECCGFSNSSRNIILNMYSDDDTKHCSKDCDRIGHPFCNTSALTKSDVSIKIPF